MRKIVEEHLVQVGYQIYELTLKNPSFFIKTHTLELAAKVSGVNINSIKTCVEKPIMFMMILKYTMAGKTITDLINTLKALKTSETTPVDKKKMYSRRINLLGVLRTDNDVQKVLTEVCPEWHR